MYFRKRSEIGTIIFPVIAGIFAVITFVGFSILEARYFPQHSYFSKCFSYASFFAETITNIAEGVDYVTDGETNVFLGSFTLPDPTNDSIVENASGLVTSKDVLLDFDASLYFVDDDEDGAFDSEEALIQSENNTLDATDEVLVGGEVLHTFSQVESAQKSDNFRVFLDQGAESGVYEGGEDILRLYVDNGLTDLQDGDTISLTRFKDMYVDANNNNFPGDLEAYVHDADSDFRASAGDSVVIAGKGNVSTFIASDGVCFDGSVLDDQEYDEGEVIWYDVDATCANFTADTDVILVGAGGVTASTSVHASMDREIGYMDVDDSGDYTCDRQGTCEPVIYSGFDSVHFSGENLTLDTVFYDASTALTDGIAITGNGWDNNWLSLKNQLLGGEQRFVYVDRDGDSFFSQGEDLLILMGSRSAATIATGQTLRFFDIEEWFVGTGGQHETESPIVNSDDNSLDPGELLGEETGNPIVESGEVLTEIPVNTRFIDRDDSGDYSQGDDVIIDEDASGYYNADAVRAITVNAEAVNFAITDSALDGLYVYESVGDTCSGSAVDRRIGSIESAPYLGQSIELTGEIYTSDPSPSKTLCLYADIANPTSYGALFTPVVTADSLTFLSSTTSPPQDVSLGSSAIQFVGPLNVILDATNYWVNQSSDYNLTAILGHELRAGDRLFVTYPVGFDPGSASMSCTYNDLELNSILIRNGNTLVWVNESGITIPETGELSCTIENVINPSSTNQVAFTISTGASTSHLFERSTDQTMKPRGVTGTSRSGSTTSDVSSTDTDLPIYSPDSDDVIVPGAIVPIYWRETLSGPYVNISYSIDGDTYISIAENIPNSGEYLWETPDSITHGTFVKILVEATDLISVLYSDEVQLLVSDYCEPEIDEETAKTFDGRFVRARNTSTIFYIDEYGVRHPFLDDVTFFSWFETYEDVEVIEITEMITYQFGSPMIPKPDTVLVKSKNSPNVYLLLHNPDDPMRPYIRWIESEEVANAIYGNQWSEYVVDVPNKVMAQFWNLESIVNPQEGALPDASQLKTCRKTAKIHASLVND